MVKHGLVQQNTCLKNNLLKSYWSDVITTHVTQCNSAIHWCIFYCFWTTVEIPHFHFLILFPPRPSTLSAPHLTCSNCESQWTKYIYFLYFCESQCCTSPVFTNWEITGHNSQSSCFREWMMSTGGTTINKHFKHPKSNPTSQVRIQYTVW